MKDKIGKVEMGAMLVTVVIVIASSLFFVVLSAHSVGVVSASGSNDNLFCHQETTSINGTSYYQLQKNAPANAAGTILECDDTSGDWNLLGAFIYPLTSVTSINASILNVYYYEINNGSLWNGAVDILIRESNGTIRTTLASKVASITDSNWAAWFMDNAKYSISSYTVVSPTDYLEVDYYTGFYTGDERGWYQLEVDNSSLSVANQTRIENWNFTTTVTGQDITENLSQTLSISITAPASFEFLKSLSQGFSLSAAVSASIGLLISLSQGFGILASIGVALEQGKSVSQDFSLSGTVSASVERGQSISQNFSMGGSVSTSVEYGIVAGQTFSISATVTASTEVSETPSQTFSIGATVEVAQEIYQEQEYTRNIDQGFSVSGSVVSGCEYGESLSQGFAISGATVSIQEYAVSLSQPLSFVESVATGLEYERGIEQGLNFTASMVRTIEVSSTLPQSFTVGATVEVTIETTAPQNYSYQLNQAFSLAGSVSVGTEHNEQIGQMFSISPSIAVNIESGVALGQGFSIGAAVNANEEYAIGLSQPFSISASISVSLETGPTEYNRQINQDFSIFDSISISTELYIPPPPPSGQEYFRSVAQGFSFNATATTPEYVSISQGFGITNSVGTSKEAVHHGGTTPPENKTPSPLLPKISENMVLMAFIVWILFAVIGGESTVKGRVGAKDFYALAVVSLALLLIALVRVENVALTDLFWPIFAAWLVLVAIGGWITVKHRGGVKSFYILAFTSLVLLILGLRNLGVPEHLTDLLWPAFGGWLVLAVIGGQVAVKRNLNMRSFYLLALVSLVLLVLALNNLGVLAI